MSRKYTLAEFCKNRGITPEWLASKDGNLEIDSRTRKLPDDELIVGGYLMIKSCAFPKFPDRVVVGGNLTIDHCDLEDLPNRIEVYGSVLVVFSSFKRIHEGCTFHQSICFEHCQLQEIADFTHVHGILRLDNCIIDTLPKGLVVDEVLSISSTNIQSIPADCRCKELIASYSKLQSIPDNWSVEVLNLTGCPITELPNGLRNLKYLNIAYTRIREIKEVYPGVEFNASNSQVRKLPDNWNAKYISVCGCPMEILPRGMHVAKDLDISETRITSIPDDCQVGRSIIAYNSQLKCVPDDLVLSGDLDVLGTDITVIPANVIAKRIFCNSQVTVDAYLFNWRRGSIDFHPNGQYVCCDRIVSKILEHKGNVWRCVDLSVDKEHFLVTDGEGHYAHGMTIQMAKADLRFKVNERYISQYETLKLDDSLSFDEAYSCYRTITGACRFGTDQFIQSLPEVKESYTIREIIELTKGQYGHQAFARFFCAV